MHLPMGREEILSNRSFILDTKKQKKGKPRCIYDIGSHFTISV